MICIENKIKLKYLPRQRPHCPDARLSPLPEGRSKTIQIVAVAAAVAPPADVAAAAARRTGPRSGASKRGGNRRPMHCIVLLNHSIKSDLSESDGIYRVAGSSVETADYGHCRS